MRDIGGIGTLLLVVVLILMILLLVGHPIRID